MLKSTKTNKKADKEANQLTAFMKNAETIDAIREDFQGNFVAICDQKVVGYDTEYSNLWNKIGAHISEKELFVSYIPKNDEALVV